MAPPNTKKATATIAVVFNVPAVTAEPIAAIVPWKLNVPNVANKIPIAASKLISPMTCH